MEARQNNGTPLIGVGIKPNHFVKRTQRGIREGTDEILNEAQKILWD